MKRILPKTMSALALAMVSTPGVWAQMAPPKLGEAANAELDSIQAGLDQYESMARRSLLGGGSKPVSFAGEAIGKIVSSTYADYPAWMAADATQFKNSFATVRLAMVAAPNRNLRLWSKMALTNALLGNQAAGKKTGDALVDGAEAGTELPSGWVRSPGTGEAGFRSGNIVYEDMCAGLVAKIGPTTWSTKLGGVLWNELSPLTVWKTQPRIFAWDYLPFELEQSTAQFYDYGTVKGEKSGRAAWNKKPFQGMQLESVELPFGMYFNSFFGVYEGYNKNQPWLVPQDKNTELQFTEGSGATETNRTYATKGTGIGDQYRFSSFLRLAKTDLPGGLAAGANWFGYHIDPDYPKQWSWVPSGETQYKATVAKAGVAQYISRSGDKHAVYALDSLQKLIANNESNAKITALMNGAAFRGSQYVNNYYVAPKVASIDVRRNIPGGINFHVDFAMSKADTTFFKIDAAKSTDTSATSKNALLKYRPDQQAKAGQVEQWQEIGQTNTGWVPGVYTTVSYPAPWFDAELRTVYFPKKFQSVGSIVNPMDGIFPYESNMTGAGKFAGSDNGTAYASNMVGSNLIVKIPVPRGHAKVSWGLHGQVEAGSDLIYFPWRQNGAAFNSTLASDFTQYDFGLVDDYIKAKNPDGSKTGSGGLSPLRQTRRLGEEFFTTGNGSRNPYAPNIGAVGGVRGTFMSAYEGFVAYKLDKGLNQLKTAADTAKWNEQMQLIQDNARTGALPQSKKFTQNLSFDASWELSRLWEGKRSLFISGYAAFNSVTKDNRVGVPAFSANDDNVLLMGRNLRFEPVFQVTPKFYVVGLIGNEVWKSNYGVSYIDSATGKAPVADADWDITKDVGKANLVSAPIDYTDWIYGLGFDWDMAARVGLHVRCQYFTHEDKGISKEVSKAKGINDYQAWLTTAEVKMWF